MSLLTKKEPSMKYEKGQVLALESGASASEVAEYKDKKRRIAWFNFKRGNGVFWHNFLLFVMCVVWLIPIIWLISCSFNSSTSPNMTTFFPKYWSANAADPTATYFTFNNYVTLWTKTDTVNMFPTWFLNTLIVSVCTCLISTLFVLQVSFAMSRMRFKGRKTMMNISMILGLFPGMLTMICVYFLFQYVFQIDVFNIRLIIAYSASSGLGYLVAKGFFDTIPLDIDEAAKIDGANELQIFTHITIPLSKPIIVYTVITSFMGPWVDFMYARIILPSGKPALWTVSIGLYNMLDKSLVGSYFGVFCAGAVMISIPLSILFMFVQKYYIAGVTGGAVKG
jgi:arabinogalactan oligomer/maltooligosaccharide transport system permease protein